MGSESTSGVPPAGSDPATAKLPRPRGSRRWTSFVAGDEMRGPGGGAAVRGLHEQGHPRHRVRVEHDPDTLLIHLSGEDGDGWTTIAVDRSTRRWAVAQAARQADAARTAYEHLYGP